MSRVLQLARTWRGRLQVWAHTAPVSSRHEIVLVLAGSSVLSGLAGLLGPDIRPETVIRAVPHPVVLVWFVSLVAGGAGLLFSAFVRDRLDALLTEWPSYMMLGCSAMVYGLCLVAGGRGTSFMAATAYLAYGIASLVRTSRILLYLNYLRRQEPRARTDA